MPSRLLRKMAAMGEKRSKKKADPATPLPRKDMVVIFLMHLSQGFQVTMLFPLIVFMVSDFGAANHNPHLIGRYAGFLASLYPFAQFCTSILWGFISDRVGRKPVLIFGNMVASVSALLFGLSGSYSTACLVRLIGGLLNGVITVTKSTLGELCDKTNQRQGFAVLSLGWGIGSIAGQVIGGVAARPCQQYNIQNCPKIIEKHPFILPCLGATFFSAVAAVAVCFLKETLNCNEALKTSEETIELVKASGGSGEDKGSIDKDDFASSDEKSVVLGGFVEGLGTSREQDEASELSMKPMGKEELISVRDSKLSQRKIYGPRTRSLSVAEAQALKEVHGEGVEDFALSDEKATVVGGIVQGLGFGQEHDEQSALLMESLGGEKLITMRESKLALSPGLRRRSLSAAEAKELTAFKLAKGEGLDVQGSSNAKIDSRAAQVDEHSASLLESTAGEETDGEDASSSGSGQMERSSTDVDTEKRRGWSWWKGKDVRYDMLQDLERGSPKLLDASASQPAEKDQFYLKDPDVWIAAGTYGMTAFIHIIGDELFPIFGAAPVASGGLEYSASSIGVLGGVSGGILFLFTILFLKINPSSSRFCFTLGTLLVLPAFILMPLTSLLPNMLTLQWWLVALLLVEKQIAACMGFTGAMVLVSNSSDASNMGAITGFSHSLGAFARAAGPFLGGSMWSFSVALRVPYSQFIPWEIITVLTLVTLGLAALAKPYLDIPKSERASYSSA